MLQNAQFVFVSFRSRLIGYPHMDPTLGSHTRVMVLLLQGRLPLLLFCHMLKGSVQGDWVVCWHGLLYLLHGHIYILEDEFVWKVRKPLCFCVLQLDNDRRALELRSIVLNVSQFNKIKRRFVIVCLLLWRQVHIFYESTVVHEL